MYTNKEFSNNGIDYTISSIEIQMQYDGIDATRVRWDLVRPPKVSQTTLGLDLFGSGVLVKKSGACDCANCKCY